MLRFSLHAISAPKSGRIGITRSACKLLVASAIAFGAGMAGFGTSSAVAQTNIQTDGAATNEFELLKACRDVLQPTERLACYDKAVGVVVAAEESGDLQIVDREAVSNTRRRLFGFSLPDIDLFRGNGNDEQMDMLETTIVSANEIRSRQWVFQTEEGAVWQISNAPMRLRPLRAGQSVVFKQASMGSYFIRINGQTGVKGRRIG